MDESKKNNNNFVGFEYTELTLRRSIESIFVDSYPSFGWELEGTASPPAGMLYVNLKFKRNRKLRNKAEITRLQRQFEAGVNEIQTLERSKTVGASAAAYIIGVVGTAFIAGSVFAYMAGMLSLMVVLAIPGFVGWISPYWCFRGISEKKAAKVNPFIDKKYDEIYEVCEKANSLLDQ